MIVSCDKGGLRAVVLSTALEAAAGLRRSIDTSIR